VLVERIMARPPAYTRDYSFSDFETNNPGQPKPGAALDTEFDDVSNALTATQDALALIQREDGALANDSVGPDQLLPGMFDAIADEAVSDAEAAASAAASSAAAAATSASGAASSATTSATNASTASGAAAQAGISQGIAQGAADAAALSATEAEASADVAGTHANETAGSVAACEAHVQRAYEWAELLPDAVDDGFYSARWWALRAEEIVGVFTQLYLGPSATPPAITVDGGPIPPGAIYYDTDDQIMYVWTGTQWRPLTTPSPSTISTYTYLASAGQTEFSGVDRFGNSLVFDPELVDGVTVYVNGVRLVNSLGGAFGDYRVDYTGNTVIILDPTGLIANSVVQIDRVRPSPPAGEGFIAPVVFANAATDWGDVAAEDTIAEMPGAEPVVAWREVTYS
jgi:hypothetical protein